MDIPSFQTFDEKLKPLELRITNLENKYVTFGLKTMMACFTVSINNC